MAIYNYREHDAAAKKLNWNVIAFEGYKRSGQKAADLKYVLRQDITNAGTKAVLEEVYKGAQKGSEITQATTKWETWTYDDAKHRDAFLALLGTPNGNGAGYILVDYAATLKDKKIVSIHTRRLERWWAMAVEYK
jgi:hypothetical protein